MYSHLHGLHSDAIVRCLVEYRQALALLSARTPPGAEPLRCYMAEAVQAMEEELRSRGEADRLAPLVV